MYKRFFLLLVALSIATTTVFAGGQRDASESPVEPESVDATMESSAMDGYQTATAVGVTVQWQVVEDMLNVQISAETTGWVAVGFDPSNKMKDANILIGYVSNGEVMLRDDYGTGQVRHGSDIENGGTSDLSNVEGEELDGTTTIRFTIPLDSGDPLDKPLAKGESYRMIVAQGSRDDYGSMHAKRGGIDITL